MPERAQSRTPWVPNLLAGLTSGVVTLVYSISFAALIFSGKLTAFFPQGVGIALIGAMVTAILVAWRSSFPFTLAGPEANSAIILTLAAASIGVALDAPEQREAVFPTVWAAIALGTGTTGLFLYLLGRFRLGRLARYIPYPVIGGFLAGTGWLITRSSFKVMTGIPLGFETVPELLGGHVSFQWLAGAVMAAILFFVLNRSKHFLTLPVTLAAGVVVGNLGWMLVRYRGVVADRDEWFFKPFLHEHVWQGWNLATLGHIDWAVLWHQWGTLLALMTIVMLSILLNSTGLELATSRNVDLDQELRANGLANIVNGCFGGMVGYLSINRCLLNQQAGARSPVAGMIAGLVCGGVLFLGSSFLAYVPKPVLGGLLLYIGTNLLLRWVIKARAQFPRVEYCLILLILVVIASLGFLQGVGVGILIACFLFILSYGKMSSIKLTLSGGNHPSNVYRSAEQQRVLEKEGDSILILVLHGFVFFGTANDLLEGIRLRLGAGAARKPVYAIFDFRLVTGVDSSAAMSFIKLRQLAEKSGLILVFTDMSATIESQLRQGGLFDGDRNGLRCFADLDHGVEWCEDRILEGAALPECHEGILDSQLQGLLGEKALVADLMPYLEMVDIAEGAYLFHEGEAPDRLYFLESGRVSVVIQLPDGRILRRGTYTGGAILGEMGFYSGATRSASVIADQPSRLHFLSRRAFEQIEREAPRLASAFSHGIVNLVALRLRRSEEGLRMLLK